MTSKRRGPAQAAAGGRCGGWEAVRVKKGHDERCGWEAVKKGAGASDIAGGGLACSASGPVSLASPAEAGGGGGGSTSSAAALGTRTHSCSRVKAELRLCEGRAAGQSGCSGQDSAWRREEIRARRVEGRVRKEAPVTLVCGRCASSGGNARPRGGTCRCGALRRRARTGGHGTTERCATEALPGAPSRSAEPWSSLPLLRRRRARV